MYARYRASPRKALEVILWLAARQGKLDFYHILKVLYFADKLHLNRYGRPIVGDRYEALPHGPVARMVYRILKLDELELQAIDAETGEDAGSVPFEVVERYWVRPLRKPDSNYLSPSDIEALTEAFEVYGSMPFKKLEELTHDESAWKEAADNYEPMRYEHLIEGENGGRAADITNTSRQVVL